MPERQCQKISQLLVDFTDGQLPPDGAREVAEHLERCGHCRQLLEDLRRSLELAQRVWEESAATITASSVKVAQAPARVRPWRRYVAAAAAVAACAAFAAIGLLRYQPGRQEPSEPAMLTPQEADRLIRRAESSARLLACADILQDQPGMQDDARSLRNYVARTYGELGTDGDTHRKPLTTRGTP